MPSGYLHALCAQRACALSGVTPVRAEVMTLGAQGPDPLFTLGLFPLRPSSRPGKLGSLLHEYRTGAFLHALCRRAKDGSDVDRDFALGFLTHYALDSTVHPYVYAHSAKADGSYSSSVHMRLEKHWDALYYHREGYRGTPVIMPGPKETQPLWPEIARLLSGAIRDVFPEQEVSWENISEALSGTAYVNRLTHSPRGVKYGFVWLAERIVGKPGVATSQMTPRFPSKADITNSAHRPWHSPFEPDVERTEGLEELYERGTNRAAELLAAGRRYFDQALDEEGLARVIGNVGYDSGMQSKP